MSLELNNKLFIIHLVDAGIQYIHATFDGGGDSGAIEEITCYDAEYKKLPKNFLGDDQADIYSQIETFCYNILSDLFPYDWYNNDGGYGELQIDLKEKNYSIDCNLRVMSTEEVSHSDDLSNVFSFLEQNGTSI